MRPRRFPVLAIIGVLLVIADQVSKYFVRQLIPANSSAPVIKGLLYFTFVQNTGAVFGSLRNTNSFLVWVTLVAVGLMLYLWDNFPQTRLTHTCLMLILAGTAGNLIDRIFLGYVTDFADILVWPVFNLADSMVTAGIIGLMLLMMIDGIRDNRKGLKKISLKKARAAKQEK